MHSKRKYEDKHKTFLIEWESLHFFVECNSKPFCFICQASLAHFKASNLHRHFWSLHDNINHEFLKKTKLCKHKLITFKSQSEKQIQVFQKFTKHSETVVQCFPYCVLWKICRCAASPFKMLFVVTNFLPKSRKCCHYRSR